jgi:hypothetical protein
MRFFKVILLLLFIFVAQNSFSAGSGEVGCLMWNNKIYTQNYKTDYAPNNPNWGPFDYFTSGPGYTVTYDNGDYPTCEGCVNPNFQFASSGTTCFIKMPNNTYEQGVLGEVHSLGTTDVPLDNYTWVLLIAMSGAGVFFIARNGLHLDKTK